MLDKLHVAFTNIFTPLCLSYDPKLIWRITWLLIKAGILTIAVFKMWPAGTDKGPSLINSTALTSTVRPQSHVIMGFFFFFFYRKECFCTQIKLWLFLFGHTLGCCYITVSKVIFQLYVLYSIYYISMNILKHILCCIPFNLHFKNKTALFHL